MRLPGSLGARLPSTSVLLALFGLVSVGIVFVQSATGGSEEAFPGKFTSVHLSRIALGFVLLFIFLRMDYRHLEALAVPLFWSCVIVLVGLLVVKFIQGGVVRWIRLPGLSLQPSEPMKLFTVLFLAKALKPVAQGVQAPQGLSPFAITAIPVLLVALQPDLGTALVLPPVLFVMAWVAGTPLGRLVRVCAWIGVLGVAIAPFALHDYQKARVLTFVRPAIPDALVTFPHLRSVPLLDALDASQQTVVPSSYQVEQSITAIGSGGPTGKGLYLGTINYLGALPESYNDFIFAVIGEEWGLVGTLGVCGLFLLLFMGSLRIAYHTREPYGRLVVIGITTQLAFQTIVNLAMTVGLTPVTGLPLPLVSYGGSAMMTSIAAVGIVLGIGMRPVRMLHPDGLRGGTSTAHSRPLAT